MINSTPHLLQDHNNSFSRTSLQIVANGNGASSPTQQLVSANHLLFHEFQCDSPSITTTGASSMTVSPSVTSSFVFVEDSLSMKSQKRAKTRKMVGSSSTASSTITDSSRKKSVTNMMNGHVQVTVFHHHHYMSKSKKNKTENSTSRSLLNNDDEEEQKKALSKLNPRTKIEKKSHSKSGLQYTVVKEEVVSCKDGSELNYEMALEDGFIWWSWY